MKSARLIFRLKKRREDIKVFGQTWKFKRIIGRIHLLREKTIHLENEKKVGLWRKFFNKISKAV